MQRHKALLGAVGAVVMSAALASPVLGSSTPQSTSKLSGTPIKIGFETALTGANSAGKIAGETAAQARVAWQNAHGGINGHPLTLIVADNGSNATTALTATQSLISQGVVGLSSSDSNFTGAGEAYAAAQGIPWAAQCVTPTTNGDPNIYCSTFSAGSGEPTPTAVPLLLKSLHVTTLDGVAPGGGIIGAASGASVQYALAAAAKCCGIQTVLFDESPTATQTTFTSDALKLKASNAQALYFSVSAGASSQGLLTALQQQGVNMIVVSNLSLYEYAYITDPVTNNVYILNWFRPWTDHSNVGGSTAKEYFAAMNKYAPGVYGGYTEEAGYAEMDLLINGLLKVTKKGASPTGRDVASGITKLKCWNAQGLLPRCVNFTLTPRSQNARNILRCDFLGQVVNKKFIVSNKGQPYCGALETNA